MAARYSEDEIIGRLFAPIAGPGALGLKDDAAFLPPHADGLVATADALVAGVHFFQDDPPAAIAQKALRVNLSDLAAKGATPLGFLLSLALPDHWTNDWLDAFAEGLAEDVARFACPLLGGDTVRTPGPLTLSIAALGRSPQGGFVPRAGARPGDAIYVSGDIGDAALGLALRLDQRLADALSPEARDHLLGRYLLPEPRLNLAPLLRAQAVAAMDLSDGLAGDLSKLCRASKVGARVELSSVPLSDAAKEAVALDQRLFDRAMTGGDDYEILCCTGKAGEAFEACAAAAGTKMTLIGRITGGDEPAFIDRQGRHTHFISPSYRHF